MRPESQVLRYLSYIPNVPQVHGIEPRILGFHSALHRDTWGESLFLHILNRMLHGPLDNYIEMHRQRHGLSQAELAVLIEVEQRVSVSHFERGLRHPNLRTLIALELIFGERLQDIFAGVTRKVEEGVRERARALLESIGDDPSPEMLAKYELLSRLVRPDDSQIIPTWREE